MATRKRRYVDAEYNTAQDYDEDGGEDRHPSKRLHHDSEETAQSQDPSQTLSTQPQDQTQHGEEHLQGSSAIATGLMQGLKAQRGPTQSVKKISIRFLIPENRAGVVIGKGGANIRKIREDTGVAVDLEGNYSWENRIAFVSGEDEERVVEAFVRVYLASQPDVGQFADSNEVQQNDPEAKMQEQASVRLLVPDRQVGGLIGRGGSKISQIREESGVKIEINSSPELPDGARGLRVVRLDGTLERILQAQKQIYATLEEAYPGDSWHQRMRDNRGRGGRGSGGPPSSRGGFHPGYDGGRGRGRGRGGRGGRGRGGSWGGDRYGDRYGEPYGGGPPAPRGFPMAQRGMGYGETLTPLGGGDGMEGGPMESEVVSVPGERIGVIIGKGGSTVRDIRQRSGCRITIHDAEYGSPVRVITLSGPKPARDNAKYLIRTLL